MAGKMGLKLFTDMKNNSGQFKKGLTPWNGGKKGLQVAWNKGKKGVQVGYWRGKKRPDISVLMSGRRLSEKSKIKISVAKKGRRLSEQTKKRMSETHKRIGTGKWMQGRKTPIETIEKFRASTIGQKRTGNYARRERSHFWRGGLSFEPYGLEFNESLREVIRNRDRRKCQMCEKSELENNKKLDIHHMDYNKQNNNPNNLISLCRNCHTKTSFNRKYWVDYFNK